MARPRPAMTDGYGQRRMGYQNPGPGGFWPVVNECVVSGVVLSEVVEEDFVVSPVVKPGFFCSAAAGVLSSCCNSCLKLMSGVPNGSGCLEPTSGAAAGSGGGGVITGPADRIERIGGCRVNVCGCAGPGCRLPLPPGRVPGAPMHPTIANIKRTVTCLEATAISAAAKRLFPNGTSPVRWAQEKSVNEA